MPLDQSDIDLALLTQWRETVERRLKDNEAATKALADERNNALKWGIMTLGAAVVGMGTWIANFFVHTAEHFK